MLYICRLYADKNEYDLHPIKSLICKMLLQGTGHEESPSWTLGDKIMKESDGFDHLGLEWEAGKKYPNIEARISSARRMSYLLFGSGLHGTNGLDPASSFKIISIYIVPALLHGLNATVLPKKEILKLDKFYRTLLRRIQSLPVSTASEAIYRLLDTLPIEALLHMRMFSLFGQIVRLPKNHPLKMVALRQLTIRENESGSWFGRIRELASTYDLDLSSQYMFPWSKAA